MTPICNFSGKNRKVIWQCNHKYHAEKCSTPHLTDDEIKAAFVSAANKVLADRETVAETFRLIRDTVFDTSDLEKERDALTEELNVVAGLIQDGIYQNAHVAQNQADYNREYDALLFHGMVEFVTVYGKDDIRFTMKDGMEVKT